jgi:hypothetical protein
MKLAVLILGSLELEPEMRFEPRHGYAWHIGGQVNPHDAQLVRANHSYILNQPHDIAVQLLSHVQHFKLGVIVAVLALKMQDGVDSNFAEVRSACVVLRRMNAR